MEEFSQLYCKMRCLLMKWEDLVLIIKDKKLKEAENIIEFKVNGKQMKVSDYQAVLITIYHSFRRAIKGMKAYLRSYSVTTMDTVDIINQNSIAHAPTINIRAKEQHVFNVAHKFYSSLPLQLYSNELQSNTILKSKIRHSIDSSALDNFLSKKKVYGLQYLTAANNPQMREMEVFCEYFPIGIPMKKFEYPKCSGLHNIGNNGFFNSALQMIKACLPFSYYLTQDDFRPFHKDKFLDSFLGTIRALWKAANTSFTPKELYNQILEKAPNFDEQPYVYQSMISLLELFHNSVNKASFSNTLNLKPFTLDGPLTPSMLNDVMKGVEMYDNSIIYDFFANLGINEFLCPNCETCIAKYKFSIGISLEVDDSYTIKEALANYFVPKYFDGYRCNNCGKTVTIKAIYELLSPAPILIIGINRFKHYPSLNANIKENKIVDYDDILDISPYVKYSNYVKFKKYRITAFTNYTGLPNSGFHWNVVYDFLKKDWQKICDEEITSFFPTKDEYILLVYMREDVLDFSKYSMTENYGQLKTTQRFNINKSSSSPETDLAITPPKNQPLHPIKECPYFSAVFKFISSIYPITYYIMQKEFDIWPENPFVKEIKEMLIELWKGKNVDTQLHTIYTMFTNLSCKQDTKASVFKCLHSYIELLHQAINKPAYKNKLSTILFEGNSPMQRRDISTELYRISKFENSIVYNLLCTLSLRIYKCLECRNCINQYINSLIYLVDPEKHNTLVDAMVAEMNLVEYTFCKACTNKNTVTIKQYIISPPPILIAYLKTTTTENCTTHLLKVEKEINIAPLLYETNLAVSTKYKILSVLSCDGPTFASYTYNLWDKKWYEEMNGVIKHLISIGTIKCIQCMLYMREDLFDPSKWSTPEKCEQYNLVNRSKL